MSLLWSLIVYGGVLIVIGALLHAFRDSGKYHIASRAVSTFGVFAGVFTLIGAGEFVTMTALAYTYGAGALMLFFGVMVGLFILAVLAKAPRAQAVENDIHLVPDYLHALFGRAVSLSSTVLSFGTLWCLLLIQFVVGALLLESLMDITYTMAVLFMSLIVTTYVFLGGFRSVLVTDKIQALFMITLGVAYVAFYGIEQEGFWSNLKADLAVSSAPMEYTVSFFFFGIFAMIGASDVWQRMLSAKNNKAVAWGFRFSGLLIFLFGCIIYLMALGIKADFPDIDPNNAFTSFLSQLPEGAAVVIGLMVFSSILSTADTELFACSVMLHKEMTRGQNKEMSVKMTIAYIAVISILTSLCALFMSNLVDIYMAFLFVLMVIGSVVFPALLGRGNRYTALVGLIGGLTVLVALIMTGGLVNGWLQLLILLPSVPCWFVKQGTKKVPLNSFRTVEG